MPPTACIESETAAPLVAPTIGASESAGQRNGEPWGRDCGITDGQSQREVGGHALSPADNVAEKPADPEAREHERDVTYDGENDREPEECLAEGLHITDRPQVDGQFCLLNRERKNWKTLRMSRKIEAAISGALVSSFASRSRWKSDIVRPAKITSPRSA